MKKPVKIDQNPLYDYNEVVEFIEDKYNIKTRDYSASSNHFPNWLKLMNEKAPVYPISPNYVYQVMIDGEMVKITKEEYDARFDEIHKQFARYMEWCKANPEPPYHDFWHWLTDNDFQDINNGCKATLCVKYWLENLEEDDWKRKILQLIYDEFHEDEMEFWIEW